MTLRGLFPLLEGHPAYRAMHDPLDKGGSAQLALLDPVRPYLLAALWDALGVPVLLLTPGPETARRLADELALFAGEAAPVLHLPETEALPFERLAPDEATVQARLRALAALARAWDAQPFRGRAQQDGSLPPCVVASLPAALQRTPRREAVSAACHTVRKGERHSMEGLLRRWLALGYRVERTADASGTVARRGGILDVFPAGADLPARLEFLGDVVESIRSFDPASQRSIEDVDAVEVLPAREVLPALGDRVRAEALLAALSPDGCRPSEMDRVRDDLSRIFAGEEVAEAGFYAGFLNQGSLLDYLPPHGLLVLDDPRKLTQAGEELDEEIARLRGQKEARGDLPRGFPSPRWPWGEIRPRLEATQHRLLLAPWVQTPGEQAPGLEAASPPVFLGKAESLADWLRRLRDGRTLVITRHDRRLAGVLREHELGARVETAVEATPSSASITLVRGYLSEGFILPLPDGPLAVLTDAEVFGTAKVPGRPGRGRAAAPRREVALAELTPGTYVVHVEHGIARFVGIKKAAGDGGEREFLVLQYAEGDKLYVPMEQLDRVSPYFAPSGEPPVLTRLGTQEWARAKQRAKESAQQMAGELLKLYAARSVLEGHPFPPGSPWQQELEEAFPYVETPDQVAAITEVKTDMESARPMDRLVCGDVGFGKTEVAVRAAFKAVGDGKQAAVLVPTTVLAQQHYHTFRDRMAPFPVRIETLSRLRTPEEQGQVLEGLRQGKVDIVIGTHRLLQKDVQFKDLGLAVIDDEHRFGVAHKERLKQMRRQVDVLTMTATPIPRTLYMALSGIRDISNIHTPPEMRQAVQTFVSEYSDDLAREAIQRELDRGGQVFFLHNRVKDINYWAAKVRELVPQARVGVGHGQMDERELEDVMAAFASGELDVLVCTTIIEAGLDLPRANTILCHRAELLGLAQMHQLRGRVGRGGQRAFAYFLVEPGKRLTEAAERRLKAILAASELGAGFRIAMKDLEIRGAGNVLGPEQSGQVHAVGFDLYVRLLEEAVRELRAGQEAQPVPMAIGMAPSDVTVDLPLAAYIPEDYIADLPVRLEVYGRLARATTVAEAAALAEELRDRFGPPPEPVKELLYVVRLKALASQAGVEAITRDGRQIVLRLREPAGGARLLLQKELDPVAKVGHQQVRLEFKGRWQGMLEWTLQRTAAFRARVLAMVQG